MPFIVLFTLVWDFFDQFAWWNPEHFSELAQGDGGGRVQEQGFTPGYIFTGKVTGTSLLRVEQETPTSV